MTRRPNVTLLAADGTRLASFGDRFGATYSLRELPPHLPRAVIAVEDRRFYEHGGIDYRGLLRAVYVNLREGRIAQGGRSEEHTSELQSLMRISYAVFCLKKKIH